MCGKVIQTRTVYILFQVIFHYKVLQNIEFPLLYSRFLLVIYVLLLFFSCQVVPALCNSKDWGTPDFPASYQLLEFAQVHVH